MKAPDFDRIFEKNFHELTADERAEMQELFSSEEEFNHMKFVMHSVNAAISQQQQQAGPSAKVKERLDHLYTETYRNKGILWYNSVGTFFISSEKKWHQQNLLRIAALFILFFTIYPFWNGTLTSEKVQLSQHDQSQEESTQQAGKEQMEAPAFNSTDKKAESPVSDQVAHVPAEATFDVISETESLAEEDVEISGAEHFMPANDDKPTMAGSTITFSTHPDGVFLGDSELDSKNKEFSVARHSDVLDILTATY